MSTEKETICIKGIEDLLRENNCELVPKAKKKNIPICKLIDDEMFSLFLLLIDISYDIVEKEK